ncbi:MAG: hypothetical protein E3J41_07015 [Candidatus Cloacimonadota bacterium]|nr:MAG: hypothetical protein E3J41_07015 [Candidatus Cloacimonadota bacterium]
MAKKIFLIILLLLIIYGIWSFIIILGVKIRYGKLHDHSKAIIKYTPTDTDRRIRRKLQVSAEDVRFTLTDDQIEITRSNGDLFIRIFYADSAVLPFGLKTIYYDQEINVSPADIDTVE